MNAICDPAVYYCLHLRTTALPYFPDTPFNSGNERDLC